MNDPLSEALDALRVLGDPSRSWGSYPPSTGMREFANAAAQRIVRFREAELREQDETQMCSTCGEYFAEASGRCRRCEASIREEREMRDA